MCHEWWLRPRSEELEASRRLWDEFERTRPLSDPKVPEDENDQVTLEAREPTPLPAER